MLLSEDYIVKINDEIEIVIEQYKEQPVSELLSKLNISYTAKNRLNVLTKKIICDSSTTLLAKVSQEDDFCFKTIKLDKFGRLKESMSLPVFSYCDLVNESWLNSNLKQYFATKIFAFTVYKEIDKNLFLHKIILWKMPEDVLNTSVRAVWEKMQECLKSGHIVKYIDDYGRYFSYFPSASDNPYVHVRPHAQNRNDTYNLPVPDQLTGLVKYPKHSFWINRSYILKIIERNEDCV